MYLESFYISGFRRFNEDQHLPIACYSSGKKGSGLTAIVGPNNSGKSTLLEALASTANQGTRKTGQAQWTAPANTQHHGTRRKTRFRLLFDTGEEVRVESDGFDPQKLDVFRPERLVPPESVFLPAQRDQLTTFTPRPAKSK